MTTLQARTYTGKEDPYGIRTSLEKFLKQRNIKALMEVLHDEYPIGTHGSTTKSLMLSSHVKSHPAVQKELADVLLNFDFSNLKTNKNVSAMLSFVYFAVGENKKGNSIRKYRKKLQGKLVEDFREGKLSSLPLSAQGEILMEANGSTTPLSESEIEGMTALKKYDKGFWRVVLMYECNPQKAIDFTAGFKDGDRLVEFIQTRIGGDPDKQTTSINYALEKHGDILNGTQKKALKERSELTRKSKKKIDLLRPKK